MHSFLCLKLSSLVVVLLLCTRSSYERRFGLSCAVMQMKDLITDDAVHASSLRVCFCFAFVCLLFYCTSNLLESSLFDASSPSGLVKKERKLFLGNDRLPLSALSFSLGE